ncbi:FAD-dependent oxidoreductase, partial [Pseudorhodoferax soli]
HALPGKICSRCSCSWLHSLKSWSLRETRGGSLGWQAETGGIDWEHLKNLRKSEVSRLNQVYERLLHEAGVELHRGWATLTGPNSLAVGTRAIRARHILLAPGGKPVRPPISGVDLAITSDDVFDLVSLPRNLAVVGSGYIAVEFASIFTGLGVQVDLIYRGSRLLKDFDRETSEFLANELEKAGVRLHPHSGIESIESDGRQRIVTTKAGRRLSADQVLLATGRQPNLDRLGLQAAGVHLTESGAIQVEDHRTSVSSIWAVGDAVGGPQLTPVALAQAMDAVGLIFPAGGARRRVSLEHIPTAIFTSPSLACCGMTERVAKERYGKVEVFRSDFRSLKDTVGSTPARTFLKVIVDTCSDRVVGLHMVGRDAGEIVQGFAVAMQCGLTKADLDAAVGIHPTVAEDFLSMRSWKEAEPN